jgi:ATP-binding cassette subfamily C (CFTR/MRP) protein 1
VDLRSLGLQRVRSKIAVIPQDPVLFSGSIRTNLDPFDEFSDDHLCNILERVGLMDVNNEKAAVQNLSDEVLEGGNNS